MAVSHKILRVFIASPGDVAEERKLLGEVISEFNTTWADKHSTRLELVKWESHTHPDIGDDAQQVINTQIGDEYHIFIGLMWGKFGTKTKNANSGTEEEFERAYERLKTSPQNVKIMFYFKDAPMNLSNIDPNQLLQVQAFKKKLSIEYGALYREFNTPEEFKELTRNHLSKLVQDWDFSQPSKRNGKSSQLEKIEDEYRPLKNFSALTDDNEEEGLFELIEQVELAMSNVNETTEKFSTAIMEISGKMERRAKEIEEITDSSGHQDKTLAKNLIDKSAKDLEVFVQQLVAEIPEFDKHFQTAIDAYEKTSEISAIDLDSSNEEMSDILEGTLGLSNSIQGAIEGIQSFRGTVHDLPRLRTTLNRAKKRTVAILDDLIAMLNEANNRTKTTERNLRTILLQNRNP